VGELVADLLVTHYDPFICARPRKTICIMMKPGAVPRALDDAGIDRAAAELLKVQP